jgi:hypothetical protein
VLESTALPDAHLGRRIPFTILSYDSPLTDVTTSAGNQRLARLAIADPDAFGGAACWRRKRGLMQAGVTPQDAINAVKAIVAAEDTAEARR